MPVKSSHGKYLNSLESVGTNFSFVAVGRLALLLALDVRLDLRGKQMCQCARAYSVRGIVHNVSV